MSLKPNSDKQPTHYSESFKKLVTKEYEQGLLSIESLQHKYGIKKSSTILSWIRDYASVNDSSMKPSDRQRIKELEVQLALKRYKLKFF